MDRDRERHDHAPSPEAGDAAARRPAEVNGGWGDEAGADAMVDADADSKPALPTWTAVYGAYFGPGTPGHCGNAGCHQPIRSGFECGATKEVCYQGMVAKGLINPANPSASLLVNPTLSPLRWFSPTGIMPEDNLVANPQAAVAIPAWLAAGGRND